MLQRGYNSTVWVSRRRRQLSRLGWGHHQENVRRNYAFLEHFAAVAPIPKPLGKRELGGFIFTRESLLPGAVRTAMGFDFAPDASTTLLALRPVYERGWIHGDLTYRNMRWEDDTVSLFDFERSGPGWPEFDVLTLYYDWRTHREGPPSYATFMRLLRSDLRKEGHLLTIVQPLYDLIPALAAHRDRLPEIGKAFEQRVLEFFQHDSAARATDFDFDEIKAAVRL